MKVYIGPYKNFIGPYQIAEKLLCWIPKYDANHDYTLTYDKYVHKFGEWLANDKCGGDSWLTKLCQFIDSKRKRKIDVRIDSYDTWGMDSTLALIILPMLKQLRDTKHGSPMVDMEDVPEHLQFTETEEYDSQMTFDFYHDEYIEKLECDVHTRWDWVLGEMVWAFEQLLEDDWMDQYKILYEPREMCGMTFDYTYEWNKVKLHEDRISNGLRLLGVHFRSLWD